MKLTVTLAALATVGSAAFTQAPESTDTQVTWMVVEHEVADFDQWRKTFEAASPIRRSVGELSHHIRRDKADPVRLTVVMKWDSSARARSFAHDPALANGMRAAGVIDGARIWICGAATAPTTAGTSEACNLVIAPSLLIGTAKAANMR